MKRLIAALLLTGVAYAQQDGTRIGVETPPAPTPDPAAAEALAKTYDGMTIDDLEAIIKADGYGYERHPAEGDNAPYISTGTANGVTYDVWLTECDKSPVPRCVGLTAQTYYFKESPKVTLKALNEWNVNAWSVRGVIYGDGQSSVVMNVGLNGGVNGAWLVARLRNFNFWAEAYRAFWNSGDPKAVPPEN